MALRTNRWICLVLTSREYHGWQRAIGVQNAEFHILLIRLATSMSRMWPMCRENPILTGAWESPTRRSTCLTDYFPGFRVLKFANRKMRRFNADRQGQDKKIPSNAALVPIPIASWRWTLFSAQNLDYSNCEKQFSHCVKMRSLGSSPVSFTKQVDVIKKLLGIDGISDMSFEAHVQKI
jgi:hypothetical protein